MKQPLVTVIVPVYKTERYLDQCVSSLAQQSYRNLEILLIEDGSPDSCPLLCDQWARRDSRVRVIHKENQGLGMARNTGMAQAEGDFLCFVDSDDYLVPNAISRALALAQKTKAQVVFYGPVRIRQNGEILQRQIPAPSQLLYQGREVSEGFLPELLDSQQANLQPGVCWCLFSAELVGRCGWQFPSEREIISEDVYALLSLYAWAESVTVLQEALYYYRVNPNSLTHVYRPDRFEQVKHFYSQCQLRCQTLSLPPAVLQSCAGPFLSYAIGAMKLEEALCEDPRQAKERLHAMVEDPILQQAIRERRNQKTGLKRSFLFWAIREKHHTLCRALLHLQNALDRRGTRGKA